jgi:PAS domain S-box-containing protein
MSPMTSAVDRSPRFAGQAVATRLIRGLLVVVAIFGATRLGTYFLMFPYASLAWPPTGVALALLLLFGLRMWPAVVVGTALSDLVLLDLSAASAPFVVFAGAAYPVLAAVLLVRAFAFRKAIDRVRDVLSLLFVSLVTGAATATLAVGGPRLFDAGAPTRFWSAWSSWALGGVMGIVVFSPLILTWAQRGPFDLRWRRRLEAMLVYGLLLAASLADFSGALAEGGRGPALYAIFPFVMWAALRFGPRGSALAHLMTSGLAIAGTARGLGPFALESLFASLLALHSFTLVVVMTSLLLAAAIAERSHARAVAEHTASRLAAVVSSITDAIVVCDRDRRLILSNPAQLRLFGIEDLGPTIATAFAPLHLRDESGEPVSEDEVLLARSLEGETLRNIRRTFRDPKTGRDVHVDVSSSPIFESGNVVGAVSVARDVTGKVELDRARDEFFSIAAHELKTPLTVQKAAVQSLERIRTWEDPFRSRFEAIARGVDRMSRVVEDMLDVSRIAASALTVCLAPTDLSKVARRVVDGFQRRFPDRSIDVIAPEAVLVDADAARITQVLRSLLENAVKFSPPKTKIAIEVARDEESKIGTVSVRDHGVGIPLDRQPNIFERFYRAHEGTAYEHIGGLGVGLYVARSIIVRHGGRLIFESEPDQGSVFTFHLPLCDHG